WQSKRGGSMNRWPSNRRFAVIAQDPVKNRSRPASKLLTAALLAATLSLALPAARADPIAPWTFMTVALPLMELRGVRRVPKWLRVRDWLVSGQDQRTPSLSVWIAWARSLRQFSPLQRLMLIQSRVDQAFAYASDAEVWGVADYWETPPEVVAKGKT